MKDHIKNRFDQALREYLVMFFVATALIFLGLVVFCGNVGAVEIDMDAIAMIESSNNPDAWNKSDDSRGLFQITPICLKEWNNFHPNDQHTLDDLWYPQVNGKIADWYISKRIPQMLRHYKLPVTTENVLVSYNCGISCVIKGRRPPITASYIQKYARLTK